MNQWKKKMTQFYFTYSHGMGRPLGIEIQNVIKYSGLCVIHWENNPHMKRIRSKVYFEFRKKFYLCLIIKYNSNVDFN